MCYTSCRNSSLIFGYFGGAQLDKNKTAKTMEKRSISFKKALLKSISIDSFEQTFWKKIIFKKRAMHKIAIFLVIFLAIGGALLSWSRGQAQKNAQQDVAVELPKDNSNVFVNDVTGVSTAVESDPKKDKADEVKGIYSKSEHYLVKEVSFGGNAVLLSGEEENTALKITDIRSEVLASRDGLQSKLLISWKTNKLSQSDVIYDNGGPSKKLSEPGFGYTHALVLSDLEQEKRYTFFIKGTDHWGISASSENFSVYTSKKAASVFELIAGQFSDMFGWANGGKK